MDHCERKDRKINPRENANLLSLITFYYTGSLFKEGYRKDLGPDDIYKVVKNCDSKTNGNKIEECCKLQDKESPCLTKVLWTRFGYTYFVLGLVDFVWRIVRLTMEPYALSQFVGCFKASKATESNNEENKFYYAILLISIHLFNGIYDHNFTVTLENLAIKIGTSFSALIYRKALRISSESLSKSGLGNIINVLTKDIDIIRKSIFLISDMWIGVIETCVSCYMLFIKMGLVCMSGVSFLLVVMPVQVILGKLVGNMRFKSNKTTDRRLQIVEEIVGSIKIIKMYAWETFFQEKITEARRKEMRALLGTFYLKTLTICLGIFCSKLGLYVMLVVYLYMGYDASPELIFYIISLFKDLRINLGIRIPYGMTQAAELNTAFKRIKTILKAKEYSKRISPEKPIENPRIIMRNLSFGIQNKTILKNVNLTLKPGLTIITGAVGSGKSSLLKIILNEYLPTSGSQQIDGKVSYASQDPWIFPSSIKQNILFGESYDQWRYDSVVRHCALDYDLNLMSERDNTIIANKGLNLSKGQQARINLARAVYRPSQIYLFDDCLATLDTAIQDYIFENCVRKFLEDKIVLLVTQNSSHFAKANTIVTLKDGAIASVETHDSLDINNAKNIEMLEVGLSEDIMDALEETSKLLSSKVEKNVYTEQMKVGQVEGQVYAEYIRLGGGFIVYGLIACLWIVVQFTDSYSEKLIAKWVDQLEVVQNLTQFSDNSSSYQEEIDAKNQTQLIYSILLVVSTFGSLIKYYILFEFCRRASIRLHRTMSNCLIKAKMAFFDTHYSGNILNRFSQDMSNIDEHLPIVFTECLHIVFAIVGMMAVVATVDWRFLFVALVMTVPLITLRILYIRTGRNLKRLEAATKSSMIGHLTASIEGLMTVRSFDAEHILSDEFDKHQNTFTSTQFMITCTLRAFCLWMDLLCVSFIIVVIGRFVFFPTDATTGGVGLTLTQVFTLAFHIQWGVRQWADFENQMTSVERALEYTEIEPEVAGGTEALSQPDSGEIKFDNVSLIYQNVTILKRISFELKPGQKLGIVGRTGAGKSSIISAIFRLYEAEGNIFVNNSKINSLKLSVLRESITIIPQDPVLFSGSIRLNLDPYKKYTDEEMWSVLDKVKLKHLFESLEEKTEDLKFSSGQKQLFSLARALLRQNKIVILDEATANMDRQTDLLLQNVILTHFESCTVITVAHRLHTILGADLVMVLDKGQILELDSPSELLKNRNSAFYAMANKQKVL